MAAVTFTFPTAKELMAIEQKLLPSLTASNDIFGIFPSVNRNTHILEWEQLDNFQGMMQPRGLGGKPPRVQAVGSKTYQMLPGVYGEHMLIEEREVTVGRQFGTINDPINVDALVVQKGNQLLHRQLKRQAWIGWQLMINGVFTVTDAKGSILHADSYTRRMFNALVGWTTPATSTPLADFRAVQLLSRGYSIDLGARAIAYGNRSTVNTMLGNTNPNDLGGKRTNGLSTVNSLPEINRILQGEDLPTVKIHDDGWEDETGAFNLDIPDGYLAVKGVRLDGGAIGNWVNTRCAVNPGIAPGPYYEVFQPREAIPPTVETHRGCNGGVALYYPSALIIMKVY
jgi:hypothetical protein